MFAQKFAFARSLVENTRVGSLDSHFWWQSLGKCMFWKSGLSLLVKVPRETLLLEVWSLSFGKSLAEDDRFGSLRFHFWWKSRGKCSFWKSGFSLLVKVSWKIFVLEAWTLTFGERLVVSSKSVKQGCPDKSVQQECPFKSVPTECQERVCSKECPVRASSKSVLSRVFSKGI